jgi:hypothetical protein
MHVMNYSLLFDILTLTLLGGGCLLLWSNLRSREEETLCIADEKLELSSENQPAEIATKERLEQGAELSSLISDARAPEPDLRVETVSQVQNQYAASVSAALARSRAGSDMKTVEDG